MLAPSTNAIGTDVSFKRQDEGAIGVATALAGVCALTFALAFAANILSGTGAANAVSMDPQGPAAIGLGQLGVP